MFAITFAHVAVSLVGIATGLVVFYGLLSDRRYNGWTSVFLATTLATNLTGFLFPFEKFLPSHALAILSLPVLGVSYYARYGKQLRGSWRQTYVVAALLALYVNVFVLVVQLFLKVPALKALAPTQTEFPFAATQLVVLTMFLGFGTLATVRFQVRPRPAMAMPTAS